MTTKPQILHIHGGATFKNRRDYLQFLRCRPVALEQRERWHDSYLDKSLGRRCEIIRPRMPCPENARYADWKIHFERHFPLVRRGVILLGSSLGGIFLARYLSEHKFPKRILSAYLVCPPFDNTLPDEAIVGGFKLPAGLSLLEKNCQRLTLLFSADDPVVPSAHAGKYARHLKKARILTFTGKNGHFKVAQFPELVEMIKSDLKRRPHE